MYSWVFLINKLEIVSYSEYLKNRIETEIAIVESEFFNNLQSNYPIFIDVEVRGLLPSTLALEYIRIDTQSNISYTYFEEVVKEKIEEILKYNRKFNAIILNEDYVFGTLVVKENLS